MTVKLKTPSNGSVSLTPQDTAADVVLTVPSGGTGSQLAVADSSGYTYSGGLVVSPQTGFKNRIINGGMTIDQRNAGASVTIATNGTYVVDRWANLMSQASKYSVQQNSGGVTPPSGFSNYMGVTSLSAYSVLAGDFFYTLQAIEGFNWADVAWGTASAQAVTLSFWVRSSLTGTFGGALRQYSGARSYPFTFTIFAANTWEYKTITIPGDTSGTWVTNNSGSLQVIFGLGVGSTYSGTAGSWAAADYRSATGATSVVGTNGATFYITGVQLEKGTVATPFEFRSIGQELALCQRYYEKSYSQSVVPGTATIQGIHWVTGNTVNTLSTVTFAVEKRAAPTVTVYGSGGTVSRPAVIDGSATISEFSITQVVPVNDSTTRNLVLRISNDSFAGLVGWGYQWTAPSEL